MVVVDEAEPLVGSFRERHLRYAVERGIPPHVTLLVPFVPAAALSDDVSQSARELFAACEPFEAALVGIASFPRHVWLAPAPRERFLELIRRTYSRYPDYPPYGGEEPEPEPHLTVGEADGEHELGRMLDVAARELGPGLPLPFRVDSVTMLVEERDGTWRRAARFPLGVA